MISETKGGGCPWSPTLRVGVSLTEPQQRQATRAARCNNCRRDFDVRLGTAPSSIPERSIFLLGTSQKRAPLFQHLQSNLSTTATLPGQPRPQGFSFKKWVGRPGDRTKKVAVVQRWPLWGGRGVIWEMIFREIQHVYCVKLMVTVCHNGIQFRGKIDQKKLK